MRCDAGEGVVGVEEDEQRHQQQSHPAQVGVIIPTAWAKARDAFVVQRAAGRRKAAVPEEDVPGGALTEDVVPARTPVSSSAMLPHRAVIDIEAVPAEVIQRPQTAAKTALRIFLHP